MSTAEILSLISLISYIVAGVSFVLAVFFWFFFGIPSVIGDLSGRTAKKSIARKRAHNERSGGKGYQPSTTNANRGKLTGVMPEPSKRSEKLKKEEADDDPMPETGLLESNKTETVESQETALLDGDATDVLVDEDATVALQDAGVPLVRLTGGKTLTMLEEIILIHTDEVI